MDMTQEEMTLGDDILKFAGICPGQQRWKRWVGMSSGGSSKATGCFFSPALVMSPANESRSATVFRSPRRCWDTRQQFVLSAKRATCRDAKRCASCTANLKREDFCGSIPLLRCCPPWLGCSLEHPSLSTLARHSRPLQGTPRGH